MFGSSQNTAGGYDDAQYSTVPQGDAPYSTAPYSDRNGYDRGQDASSGYHNGQNDGGQPASGQYDDGQYAAGQYTGSGYDQVQHTNGGQYNDGRYNDAQYANGGGQYANGGQYSNGGGQYSNGAYDPARYNDSGQYNDTRQDDHPGQYANADQYGNDQYSDSQHSNGAYDQGGIGHGQFPAARPEADQYNPTQYETRQHLGQQNLSRRQLRRPVPRRRTGHRIAQVLGGGALAAALIVAVLAFLFPGTLPGTGSTSSASPIGIQGAGQTPEVPAKADATADSPPTEPEPEPLPSEIPDLGPKTLAKIPAGSRQVVVAEGRSKNSSYSEVTLYHRTSEGWQAGATWPARNGRKGWTAKHREDDLRSPVGVFALTDTGGLLPDVGGKLPYHQSDLFKIDRLGMLGQPLAGSYDYVIAINYNRRSGRSPLDRVRPLGDKKGGGIWLHVRSDGPTQACVSLTRAQMRTLVKTLDPAKKPVIVMGDRASISK